MKATTTPVLGIQPCEYDRSRTYGWNGENRLISAENGDTRLEFNYDYMGRRFEKKVYSANVLTKHEKFVYDGYKLIQVLDALNDNAVTMTFVWHPESTGLDTPFSMTYNGEIYYYVTDGNKNVTALLDADGNRAAEYIYHPFGTIYSKTGPMVDLNPFRFSSEYHDDETGLVYYNYRYYSPELGRWISRDPIEEEGGVNLYAMVGNNPVNYWDWNGFFAPIMILIPPQPAVRPPEQPKRKFIGCCGKDVTEKLDKLLANVKNELMKDQYAFLFLNISMFAPSNGWDIKEFFNNDSRLGGKPDSSDCRNTVAYRGKCFEMAKLNYVLWGVIGAASQYHLNKHPWNSSFEGAPEFINKGSAWFYTNFVKGIAGHDEGDSVAEAASKKLGFVASGWNSFTSSKIDTSGMEECKNCRIFFPIPVDNSMELTARVRINSFWLNIDSAGNVILDRY